MGKVTKAIEPTAARLAIKGVLMVLVALGFIDNATAVGILNDPIVLAMAIILINMIRKENAWRRQNPQPNTNLPSRS